jgi:hypothetical protein
MTPDDKIAATATHIYSLLERLVEDVEDDEDARRIIATALADVLGAVDEFVGVPDCLSVGRRVPVKPVRETRVH